MNAATTGYGAPIANQATSVPSIGRITSYSSLTTEGHGAITAQRATIDLGDVVNVSTVKQSA